MSDIWHVTKERAVSLVFACVYGVGIFFSGRDVMVSVITVVFFLVIALGLIWFGDEVGALQWPSGPDWKRQGRMHRLVFKITPGVFYRLIGWVLLLIPLILALVEGGKNQK